MNQPEQNLWFSLDCQSVLSVALQDSMRVPKELPDYPVAIHSTKEWRNIRDRRKLIREDNSAILSGREYVRDFFKGNECIGRLEEMWAELDADPSKELDYRRRVSPHYGGKDEAR